MSTTLIDKVDAAVASFVTAFLFSSATTMLRSSSRDCKTLFERNCPSDVPCYESSGDLSEFFEERPHRNPLSPLRCWALTVRGINECATTQRGLWRDRRYVMPAVMLDGMALRWADATFRRDRKIVMAAVTESGSAIQWADESFKREDRDMVLTAVSRQGSMLQIVDERFKRDREIALAAVTECGNAILWTDITLQRDRGFVLAAVTQTGLALEFATETFQSDREICFAAVKQNNKAMKYVSESLTRDTDWLRAAVTENGNELTYDRVSTMSGREMKEYLRKILYRGRSNLRRDQLRAAMYTAFDLHP